MKVKGRVSTTRPFNFGPVNQFLSEYLSWQFGESAAGKGILHHLDWPMRIRPVDLLAFDSQLQGALNVPQFDNLAA
jgi:hypothetical protein